MKIVNVNYIDPQDIGYDWNFSDVNLDYKRLSDILDYIKKKRLINSLKEFAENIEENSVGLNDIKKGRKKISVKHIINIGLTYPYINTDYVLLKEGLPFENEYLIKKIDQENRTRIEINLKLAKAPNSTDKILENNPEYINKTKRLTESQNSNRPTSIYSNKINIDIDMHNKLMNLQNQLLEAKNEIIRLKDKIHKLQLDKKR